MRQPAFWDSSALVPLCVQQALTSTAVLLYQQHEIVVWWVTPVEIASALARLDRMNHIGGADYARARKLAGDLSDRWSVIQPSESVRAAGMRLVDHYELRAADSLQLAAALQWCGDAPRGRVFLTADQKLREAAFQAGFDTSHF